MITARLLRHSFSTSSEEGVLAHLCLEAATKRLRRTVQSEDSQLCTRRPLTKSARLRSSSPPRSRRHSKSLFLFAPFSGTLRLPRSQVNRIPFTTERLLLRRRIRPLLVFYLSRVSYQRCLSVSSQQCLSVSLPEMVTTSLSLQTNTTTTMSSSLKTGQFANASTADKGKCHHQHTRRTKPHTPGQSREPCNTAAPAALPQTQNSSLSSRATAPAPTS